ncbi:hypothetical protein DEF95_002030 [Xanthomonas vasicola]|nr:hypothetical protein DEF95_002030 [Xanthomonas vasicola]
MTHRASRIAHRASCIVHRASCIVHRASLTRLNKKAGFRRLFLQRNTRGLTAPWPPQPHALR